MFKYYLLLGFRSLRRAPLLTGLMVLTLAVGVSASMSTLTVLYVMSSDPIPSKSHQLFVPLLDNSGMRGYSEGEEPPSQLTYMDALALLRSAPAARQTAIYGVGDVIESTRPDLPAFLASGAAVNRDFFAMFDVPFVDGAAWSADDEQRGALRIVIRKQLAERLFGEQAAVGKALRLGDAEYIVSGVLDEWRPLPKFYRLIGGNLFAPEDYYLPLATAVDAEMYPQGSVNCNIDRGLEPGFAGMTRSDCVWIQFWAELPDSAARERYREFLDAYVGEQKLLGRFPRPLNNRLHSLREWLEVRQVVSNDSRLQTWLAFGFLLVCLVNTMGLMLAKFSSRAGEIGVRRALGAPRRELFKQYLTEAGVIGLAGAGVGLALTLAALWLIGKQSRQLEAAAQMDWLMLLITLCLAVAASILAGLLPTWRACQVTPAIQLKSQ